MGILTIGSLGTLGVIKLVGGLSTLIGCSAGLYNMPDTAFRRKLSRLYRNGDICVKRDIKKQDGKTGIKKFYPYTPLRHVRIYSDRIQATIFLPDGLEPKAITDNKFIFQQVFGEWAHLEQKTAKHFELTVWPKDLVAFDYDAKKVLELVKRLHVPVYAGMSRTGNVVYDMFDFPNLLIAGEPGGGKSVELRQILTTWLLHIDNLVLYCADLKRSEFHLFEGLAEKVAYDETELDKVMNKILRETIRRGDLLNKYKVAHIKDLPKDEHVPIMVLAIDEVAVLVSKEGKAIMQKVAKGIALGRALGIYYVLSMQRPDREVLNGKIKNCLTVRLAFRHTDLTNSQISLGQGHGEAAEIKPTQKGRAALLLDGVEFVQAPFLDLKKAEALLAPLKEKKNMQAEAEPEEDEDEDEEFKAALLAHFPGLYGENKEEEAEEEEPPSNVIPLRSVGEFEEDDL